MTKLTQKQRTFCQEYFKTGHATNSAITAGYSPNTAQEISSENLSKPIIQQELDRLNTPTETKAIATKDEKLAMLTGMARDTKTATQTKINAIREANHMQGHHAPIVQRHEGQVSIPIYLVPARDLLSRPNRTTEPSLKTSPEATESISSPIDGDTGTLLLPETTQDP